MSQRLDSRQVISRDSLDQVALTVNKEVDDLLRSMNSELTVPLRLSPNNSGIDRVVVVGSATVTNPETARNRTVPPISNTTPSFTGGTITFPSSDGGSIVPSVGSSAILNCPAGQYVRVGINLNSSGQLVITQGSPGASLSAATAASIPTGTLPLGFIAVHDTGGTIDFITHAMIYSYGAAGGASQSAGSGEINIVINPDADTALDDGRTNDVGDWVDSGTGTTSSRTTTTGDIPLYPTKTNAIKILNDGSSTGYTYMRMTLPQSLYNRKLKISWEQFVSTSTAYASGDFKVELYSNASSNYGGAYTAIALSTDSSGVSSIPALTGRYQTTFDTSTAAYLELRITRTAGTANSYIALNSVTVGPGIQPQGAAVDGQQSWTPTFAGLGTVSALVAKWQRIGDRLAGEITVTAGTVTASNCTFTLPNSYLANTDTVSGSVVGRWMRGNASGITRKGGTVLSIGGRNTVNLTTDDYTAAVSPFAAAAGNSLFNNSEVISIEFSLPISDWAGSGTVNLAQNDVEYAFNTANTDADDTSSFGYGPAGNAVPSNVTANRDYTVRFQSPIQATDALFIQIAAAQTGPWKNVDSHDNNTLVSHLFRANATSYGMGIKAQTVSSTDIKVMFGSYASSAGATTWGGAGFAWSSVPGNVPTYWRVVKAKAGAAVGFGLADSSNSGLIKAQQYRIITSIKTSNYTATRGDRVLTNSTSGMFNVTLPASPLPGDVVEIIDAYGTWSTNAVTALRNGSNINGAATDLTLNVSGRKVEFIYIDSTQGWRAY